MAYQFSQQIVDQLSALLEQNRFADAYQLVATTLTQEADLTDHAIEQVRIWFLGASQINRNEGIFNDLIRAYTFRQGQLHFGDAAETLFSPSQIQLSSNQVARNAITDIINNNGLLPTINDIADNDAIGVRDILFNSDDQDTAFTNNAAWSGTLLFSMLDSDQTYRLLGNDNNAKSNNFHAIHNRSESCH